MKKILLSSFVAVLLLTACTDEKKVEEKSVQNVKEQNSKVEEKVQSPEAKLVEQVKESSSEVATKIVEESKKVAEAGVNAAKSVSEKVANKTQEVSKEVEEVTQNVKEVTNDVVEKASETKDKIEESINTIVASKNETASNNSTLVEKGKAVYLKCAGCHGTNGEKPALGKSKVIKGWSEKQIVDALNGYKTDSYGGPMKGVMKGQVANLSDEDIKALGAYISKF